MARPRIIKKSQEAKIVRMYLANSSWQQIQKVVGVSTNTINRVLKENGQLQNRHGQLKTIEPEKPKVNQDTITDLLNELDNVREQLKDIQLRMFKLIV